MEKKNLSKADFKQICSEALKYSTGWTDYVHEVRVRLRSWLGDRDPRGAVPAPFINPPTTEQEKTQAELDVLMSFLKGRCIYDFFPGETLTQAAVEDGKSWVSVTNPNDESGEAH